MFCSKCGTENAVTVSFCSQCGTSTAPANAAVSGVTSAVAKSPEEITFTKAIPICFSKYFDFKGRASRPEFWWFYLFTLLISWAASVVDSSQILSMLFSLAVLFPTLAAGARRLHDNNRSGWWQLIALTVIGLIPLIIWLASKGSDQENRFGSPV